MLAAFAPLTTAYTAPMMMSTNPDAPIKIGVNGFGRIGRQVVRIAMEREAFVLKHINSPMSPEYMKYLLEHDTVHGRFKGTCAIEGDGLTINGLPVSLSATRESGIAFAMSKAESFPAGPDDDDDDDADEEEPSETSEPSEPTCAPELAGGQSLQVRQQARKPEGGTSGELSQTPEKREAAYSTTMDSSLRWKSS